jgi:hypothetical protein
MTTRIAIHFIATFLSLAIVLPASAQTNNSVITPTHRIDLFDGKSLNGWTFVSKDTNAEAGAIWSVTNGVIVCTGKPYGYARTLVGYRDYQLHAEWRWPAAAGNSGVFLHVTGADKVWPMCLEAQLAAGRAGDIRFNGGSMLEGKPADFKAAPRREESSEKPPGEWNSYDIVCVSSNVTVHVNGVLQNEIAGASVAAGAIGLQAEGALVEFRNVWVGPVGK